MNHSASTKHSIITRLLRSAFLAAALLAGLSSAALATESGFGEVKVLAKVPQPGFPEGIV
jgi:hypothetical protein